MSPEWVSAVGLLALGGMRLAWDIWRHRKPKAEAKPPDRDEGEPPAAAA